MVPSDKGVDEDDDNASAISDGNGQVENNTEYMNSEEQEEVEIGNGENENCDEELRIDDNTETKQCDQQFMSSVEIASGEPNEQSSEASDEQIIDGEVNEPDSDNTGIEDSDLDVENCANVGDEDDEEIQHLSIDSGV